MPGIRPTPILLLSLLGACSARPSGSDSPRPPALPGTDAAIGRVHPLADAYYRAYLEARPLSAFHNGITEVALDRLDENEPAARRRWEAHEDAWLARLREIPPTALGRSPERITYAVLRTALEAAIARRACRDQLWNVTQQGGVQQAPAVIAAIQPVGTAERRARALVRFRAFAPYLEVEVDNLRQGVRQGYTAPRIAVEQVIEQLDGLLATGPERSPVLRLAERDAAAGFRDSVTAVVRESLHPALARYRDFLRREYLPRARVETAVTAMPNGAQCYRARLEGYITLPLEPEAVHRMGLEQMARIEAEARPLALRLFGTDDMPAVYRQLREDPALRFASRQEVVDTANAVLERARAALPHWFGRLPRARMIVDPCLPYEEMSGCPNSYSAPALDGSRPGHWRINTSPERASRVDLESIAFHEGYPGHHLDRSLAQERPDAHPVTRILGNSGFSEGWGLYAEQLADEMGLYSGDLAQLGRLSSAAFRAARLVVDPGLHALGWSREQAIEYLLAHSVKSPESARSEVDRYIVNPGQATAYMIGQLEITRLRAEAERRVGTAFDVREFHDRVLGNGRVPLPFLREEMEGWIRSRGGR